MIVFFKGVLFLILLALTGLSTSKDVPTSFVTSQDVDEPALIPQDAYGPVVFRARRFYDYNYDFQYYYYEYDPDYVAEERKSLLETLNEHAKQFVVVGASFIFVAAFWLTLCCCVCRRMWNGMCEWVQDWCDRVCRCRGSGYRNYCKIMEAMDLPKPTYKEYKRIEDMFNPVQ